MVFLGMENLETIQKYGSTLFKSLLRGRVYSTQYNILNTISTLAGEPLRSSRLSLKYGPGILREMVKTYHWHAQNIAQGIYPKEVVEDLSIQKTMKDFLGVLKDYPGVIKRRKKNETKLKRLASNERELPEYY